MKKSTISKQWSNTTDLFSTLAVKSHKLSMLWLMLLTLLLLPTRMVAHTTTEDPRCALFSSLDGITDVTITDNGSYPWQMLDLEAEGMKNLHFNIPKESKGLMSSNYHVHKTFSETVVKFEVTKPMLLTFKYLASSETWDKATVTLDNNKEYGTISENNQIEVKALLPVGKHSLKLSYKKDYSTSSSADRAFIYDMNTATTISDYVAEYDATNQTLTFKTLSSDNLGSLDLNNIVIANNELTVSNMCSRLGIDTGNIKSVVFDKSFNTYALTSLIDFFKNCSGLETISGLEYLNTANVTDISYMFAYCSQLSSLNLSNFNTTNVKNMSCMFYSCKNLSSLNLYESFNTANVTDMSYMFAYCSQLSSLNLSNFNTTKVKNMYSMFYYCSQLSSLDLSNFNTANVKNMSYMFNKCQNLSSLDLSMFNTANVTNMSDMFAGSSTLQTIYASDNFVVTGITNKNYKTGLFTGCEALKGALPEYDKTKTSSEYANYKTGYFTKLVVRNGDKRYGITGETAHLTVDNLTLADDKDLVVFDPFTATAASYSRTINPGTTWATLCLPFGVSLDGKNFRAFKLLSANEATNTVELEEITTIEAGTPVIIKMKEGETTLSISEANKKIAHKVVSAADGSYQLQGLYTKKVFDKVADNNCYIVKGNKLMNPAMLLEKTKVQKVASKPFRAYMVDKSSATA
uniref:BspA family leucine-rich repeat surface protein n=3 Tax=Prevotella sp. TaxID=59823 RepID=UPI0027E2EADE